MSFKDLEEYNNINTKNFTDPYASAQPDFNHQNNSGNFADPYASNQNNFNHQNNSSDFADSYASNQSNFNYQNHSSDFTNSYTPEYSASTESYGSEQSVYNNLNNTQNNAPASEFKEVYDGEQSFYSQQPEPQQYQQINSQQYYNQQQFQSAYGQQMNPQQPNNVYSNYYNKAYNNEPQRTYSDGDRLTRFKDYYDLFASQQTKKWTNILIIICYTISTISFIAGLVMGSASLLDFVICALFSTLLLTTKQWGFALVLSIYNGITALLYIILFIFSVICGEFTFSLTKGMLQALILFIFSVMVTAKLKKLKKGFKQGKYTPID